MGKLLDSAIYFATNAHADQLRKGANSPYILHPLEAATIVSTMTADEEIFGIEGLSGLQGISCAFG